jgi:hypothetical protein
MSFSRGSLKHADLLVQSQILQLERSALMKIEDRVARRGVRKMGIGKNYERKITPILSNISARKEVAVLQHSLRKVA